MPRHSTPTYPAAAHPRIPREGGGPHRPQDTPRPHPNPRARAHPRIPREGGGHPHPSFRQKHVPYSDTGPEPIGIPLSPPSFPRSRESRTRSATKPRTAQPAPFCHSERSRGIQNALCQPCSLAIQTLLISALASIFNPASIDCSLCSTPVRMADRAARHERQVVAVAGLEARSQWA